MNNTRTLRVKETHADAPGLNVTCLAPAWAVAGEYGLPLKVLADELFVRLEYVVGLMRLEITPWEDCQGKDRQEVRA